LSLVYAENVKIKSSSPGVADRAVLAARALVFASNEFERFRSPRGINLK
jgi:hypothetical protein